MSTSADLRFAMYPVICRRQTVSRARLFLIPCKPKIPLAFRQFERLSSRRVGPACKCYWAFAAMEMSVKDFPPIRVLLVEDEFLIGELVADYLAEQGFAVRYVANGVDALRHLAAEPVDVLFTDIDLPGGIDGTTLARSA